MEEYISELHSISETVKVRKGKELKKDYFDIPDMDYFLIKEKNIIIGFALIGYRSNCKIGVDKYISEFYIIPQYRRKHCGEKAIKEILQDTNSAILAIKVSTLLSDTGKKYSCGKILVKDFRKLAVERDC